MTNPDLANDIRKNLFPGYFSASGAPIVGESVSGLMDRLRNLPPYWKNLGNLNNLESICEREGFKIISGRNRRGGRCRIVTE